MQITCPSKDVTKHPKSERGSKMRLFETNENEAIDSPTPRNNDAKMPHCEIYNPMTELTRRALHYNDVSA